MSNKSLSLWGLSNEYVELYNALIETADTETGEVDIDISKALEKVQGAFEEKAIATATVWRALGKYSKDIDEEIKRLQALKAHTENQQKKVEYYLTEACNKAGIESIKGIYANISFKTNPPKVVFDDESLIPEEYITETVKVEKSISKTKIKEAIQSGIEVAGARLVQERKIQIK